MTPAPSPAVAITGLGVLTPLADRPEALAAALLEGRSAIAPAAELGGAGLSRMADDFDPARYANIRGLRLYSRATKLGICAVRLALDDAKLDAAACPSEQLGTVTASTLGHVETLFEYDRSVVAAGPLRGNPALMPLALPSSPGAAVALSFVAKAFSMSLSDAGTSSLDALGLGARLVAAGRARACVVVGTAALCADLSAAASKAGLLAPAEAFRVLDRRRRGTALGEGAAAVVLERAEEALARGARLRAIVAGQATAFAPGPADRAGALRRACGQALADAGLTPGEVALVSAGLSGGEGDRAEAVALLGLLGESAGRTPLLAPKASLGETLDAAGLLQALAALAALSSGKAPPIPRLEDPDPPGLCTPRTAAPVAGAHALVTATAHTGGCAALVLTVPHG
ncbi:MAG TPA: beta-ketoacyl synthase N-terminal-like domain-containing protein [Anaeromyxobacter sp.]|nr:beta-ketoacyl synthase N-terminal-like domain-containing protein [Anaeromyxobacter sp.]